MLKWLRCTSSRRRIFVPDLSVSQSSSQPRFNSSQWTGMTASATPAITAVSVMFLVEKRPTGVSVSDSCYRKPRLNQFLGLQRMQSMTARFAWHIRSKLRFAATVTFCFGSSFLFRAKANLPALPASNYSKSTTFLFRFKPLSAVIHAVQAKD